MKKFHADLILKDSFYQECGSPVLPIPFSMEDLNEMRLNNGISFTIITDNLLQMVSENSKLKTQYRFLILHCCLIAGGEAARMGDHKLSNHYLLAAADYSPDSFVVRKNLARSFQHLQKYQEAVNNYKYVILNHACDDRTWVYFIECLYAIGEIESATNIIKLLRSNAEQTGLDAKISFGAQALMVLSEDNAPEELKLLFKKFFTQ